MNIHCGFREDRESIVIETTLGDECHFFEWPVTDIPVIVKSIRLAATGEWSFECDPRVYCKGDQIELAERVKVSRRGRSSLLSANTSLPSVSIALSRWRLCSKQFTLY